MIIDVKEIHKSFGPNEVLKGINVSVDRGEVIAIIGASGGGKSTLLRVINGLEPIDSGEILVCDVPVHNPKRMHEVHQHVGMVFQQFNLFPHLTALGNVTLALRRVQKMSSAKAAEIAKVALDRVDLADKAHQYPSELSGGQQQRVAIARSLALEPKVMLFDEATSALDPELIGEVTDVIRSLAQDGMTMLMVTHEMDFAREIANRVLYVSEGVILEEGPPTQIFSKPQQERTKQFLRRIRN